MNERYQPNYDTIFHSNPGFRVYPNYDTIKFDQKEWIILRYPKFDKSKETLEKKKSEKKEAKIDRRLEKEDAKIDQLYGGNKKDYTPKKEQPKIIEKVVEAEATKMDSNYVSTSSIIISTKVLYPVHKEMYGVNNKILAIRKDEFDKIEKTTFYDTRWKLDNIGLSFGLLTVPFKFRPGIKSDSVNFNLTTDVTLGPYLGFTKRISKEKRYYITLPINLGLSYININNHNTSNKEFDDKIGVVPGISFSSGIVFQLDGFNLGFVSGKDWASGVGEDWIYHKKWWFSFAIGYNFITKE